MTLILFHCEITLKIKLNLMHCQLIEIQFDLSKKEQFVLKIQINFLTM